MSLPLPVFTYMRASRGLCCDIAGFTAGGLSGGERLFDAAVLGGLVGVGARWSRKASHVGRPLVELEPFLTSPIRVARWTFQIESR